MEDRAEAGDERTPVANPFLKEKHVKFLERCCGVLPSAYGSLDTNRMTLLFFALSGLDILDSLSGILNDKDQFINWIYAQQLTEHGDDGNTGGFVGSGFIGMSFDEQDSNPDHPYAASHVAMTYTALCCLLILGDDLARVNRKQLALGLRRLQLADGSFCPLAGGSENDMRFIYCACCISYILDDWSGIDKERLIGYIRKSLSYDHGISQGPGCESHGGSTFCALASLHLLGSLHDCLTQSEVKRLVRWCLVRQKSGFQGRPNKPVDTCYSFWVGASVMLLNSYDFIDKEANRLFLLSTQNEVTGGFSKWPDFFPDALHTYFGLCGLSLMGDADLKPINPALNISQRVFEDLKNIHKQWQDGCDS